jgi:hypothetical protein
MRKFDKMYKQLLESIIESEDWKKYLAPEIPDAEKADFNPNPGPDDSIYPTRHTKSVPDKEMYRALGNRTLEDVYDEINSAKFKGNVFPLLIQIYNTIHSNVNPLMYSKYSNRLLSFLQQDPDLSERIAADQAEWLEQQSNGGLPPGYES